MKSRSWFGACVAGPPSSRWHQRQRAANILPARASASREDLPFAIGQRYLGLIDLVPFDEGSPLESFPPRRVSIPYDKLEEIPSRARESDLCLSASVPAN